MDAAKDLHQRGFAGAVLPCERNHFAWLDLQIHGVQSDDSCESLADSLHFQDRPTHRKPQLRPRSRLILVVNSATLFCWMISVGIIFCLLVGIAVESPPKIFAIRRTDW